MKTVQQQADEFAENLVQDRSGDYWKGKESGAKSGFLAGYNAKYWDKAKEELNLDSETTLEIELSVDKIFERIKQEEKNLQSLKDCAESSLETFSAILDRLGEGSVAWCLVKQEIKGLKKVLGL